MGLIEGMTSASHCWVSHVTALEIQLKAQKNPTAFQFSLQHLKRTMKEFSLKELPISYLDIKKHKDPFELLLMAQAAQRDLALVKVDKDIRLTFERHKEFRVFKEPIPETPLY